MCEPDTPAYSPLSHLLVRFAGSNSIQHCKMRGKQTWEILEGYELPCVCRDVCVQSMAVVGSVEKELVLFAQPGDLLQVKATSYSCRTGGMGRQEIHAEGQGGLGKLG